MTDETTTPPTLAEIVRLISNRDMQVAKRLSELPEAMVKGGEWTTPPPQSPYELGKAILAALSQPARPVSGEREGWVLVPREPTREMWAAMGDALVGYRQRHHDAVAQAVWNAALAKADAILKTLKESEA